MIALVTVMPSSSSSAAPTPDPGSQYCVTLAKYYPALANGFEELAAAGDLANQKDQMDALETATGKIATTFQNIINEGKAPAEFATMLKNQADYWKQSNAYIKNPPVLNQNKMKKHFERMEEIGDELTTLLEMSSAYCTTSGTTTPLPTTPKVTSPTSGSVISQSTVALTGTADSIAIIEVKRANATVCTTEANFNGNWSCSVNGLTNGSVSLVVTARNAQGQQSQSVTVSYTVSLTPTTTPPGSTAPPTTTPPGADYVSLSGNTWQPASSRTVTQIPVSSNGSWTATSDSNWLRAKQASGKNNGTFKLVARKNNGPQRIGHVTVKAGGATTVLTVTQGGDTSISVTPGSWSPGSQASTTTFTVSTLGTWTAKPKANWVHVVQNGNQMTVTVDANPRNRQRSKLGQPDADCR